MTVCKNYNLAHIDHIRYHNLQDSQVRNDKVLEALRYIKELRYDLTKDLDE